MDEYYKQHNKISGWFNHIEIIPVLKEINKIQENVTGNFLEIGVYHGKSFIPLLFLMKDQEKAVALDVFEDQHLNYDKCGEGSRKMLKINILKFFNETFIKDRISIVKNDSTKLTHHDYLKLVKNKYRIISIDGCHTKDATYKDIDNCSKLLTDYGVIIIDDYFNNHWPGVKAGTDLFLSENNNFRVFYFSANKFMICHKKYFDIYNDKFKNFENNNANKYYERCIIANVWKS